ncbi:hypothetical protein [Roseibium sp. MMSF_3412]|uniref:hypothetical protein n=1 Tax=Roseibium sp. MMSF_3412 TaxID=3046712 RepID=UPI0027402524|nr:hypothetical protein [Roseibium sp. MMSF_3412]
MILKAAFAKTSQSFRTRAGLLSVSTALVLMSGTALAQDTGKAAFDAYIEGLKNLGLEYENGSVDYDEGSDTLTLTDSTLTFSGVLKDIPVEETDVSGNDGATAIDPSKLEDITYSLSFNSPSVTITGLTHDNGSFTSKSWVWADNSQLLIEGARESRGRLKVDGRMSGISATNYEFVLPEVPAEDPARRASRWLPFVKATLLTSYDEVRVDSTGVTIEAYAADDGKEVEVLTGTIQMDGYLMAGARDGRIAEYSIDQMTQNLRTLEPASGQMLAQTTSQGKTVYSDLDIKSLIDLFDPSVPETGEEKTLIGSGSAVDYKSSQEIAPGVALKIEAEKATLDKATIVKRDNNLLAMLDKLFNKEVPGPEELITNVFQFYRSFAYSDARISGVSIIFPLGPGLESAIKIKEMAMTDIGSNGIGEMMLVGLDAPNLPEGISAKLDWAAIGDIEFAEYEPIEEIIGKLVSDPTYGENNPLEVARAFMPRSLAYEVEGLEVNVPEIGLTALGKLETTLSTTVPPFPTSLFSKTDGLRIPVKAVQDPQAQALFQGLGLETIVWSDEARLYWDEATQDLRLERLMIDIEGVGRAEASLRFANVPKALFEDPEGQGQLAAISAQFVDASITFNDAGLTGNGLKFISEAQGIPQDALKQALIAQAAGATAPIQNEAFTKMVSDAASKFLNDPKDLKITLTPANPVPLAQILGSMAAPQTLPDLLNVKIEAN